RPPLTPPHPHPDRTPRTDVSDPHRTPRTDVSDPHRTRQTARSRPTPGPGARKCRRNTPTNSSTDHTTVFRSLAVSAGGLGQVQGRRLACLEGWVRCRSACRPVGWEQRRMTCPVGWEERRRTCPVGWEERRMTCPVGYGAGVGSASAPEPIGRETAQTLDRGLQLLQVLGSPGAQAGLTVTELAERLG